MECTIAKGNVDNTICANLCDSRDTTRFEEFAQSRYEGGRCGGCCARVLCDMSAEARVDDELAAMVWFRYFEKEYTLFITNSLLVSLAWGFSFTIEQIERTEDRS